MTAIQGSIQTVRRSWPPAVTGLWLRLAQSPLIPILGLYLLSRAALAAIGYLAVFTVDDATYLATGRSLWCRWDCGWYLDIVRNGYSTASAVDQPGQTNFAFFPVYPILISALSALLGIGPLTAALTISNLCFVAALVYIHRYARLLGFSPRTALLSVALMCFVPQGFVFSAAYTESLFVLLLAGAMVHLRQGQFLVAGLMAATLSAVRANGVFFVFFALFWIVRSCGWATVLQPWRRPQVFVPVVLAPLGLFCFWFYAFISTGDAFAQASTVAHGWGWHSDLPWRNLATHLRGDIASKYWALCSLAAFGSSLLLLRYRLYEEFCLCALILLLLWTGQIPNSLLRYTIVLFPIAIALARCLEGRVVATACVFSCFSLLNGFLMTAWTIGRQITI